LAYQDGKPTLSVKLYSVPPAEVDYDMWLGPAPKRPFNEYCFHYNFRFFWDYSGGMMSDWGAHLLGYAFLNDDEANALAKAYYRLTCKALCL
jgi:hypothetical protein